MDIINLEDQEPEKEKKSSAMEKVTSAAIKHVEESLTASDAPVNYNEGSKQIAHALATAAAMDSSDSTNEPFLSDIKKQKQDELKQSFLGEKFKEEAKKYAAKQKKAEAFYTNVRPILEFDFSPLIPKSAKTKLFKARPRRDKRGNILQDQCVEDVKTFEEKVDSKPTYQDRSYGIPLMILMLCLLTIPYCVITVILAIGNGINAIFNGIARFGKPALIICGTLVGAVICILAVYCMLRGVDILFGTNILNYLSGGRA